MLDKHLNKYVGRKFEHGKEDCYSLIREFYKDEFGIELRDYPRENYWWTKGQNLYMENFRNEGFYLVDESEEFQYGDVFLIALGSEVACHGAIYVGENKILQHVQGHYSSIDRYMGIFRNFTVARVRHKDIKKKGTTEYVFDKETVQRISKPVL